TGIKVDANIIISNENKNHPSSLKKEGYKYMALLFALLTMVITVIYLIQ
ncbi:transcriptional regulator, partial [Salmonella enterica]|nr:transcriptional regulator [Salmonella enterica]EKJ9702697.1 transcriptional regulator [Salmonella enterica]